MADESQKSGACLFNQARFFGTIQYTDNIKCMRGNITVLNTGDCALKGLHSPEAGFTVFTPGIQVVCEKGSTRNGYGYQYYVHVLHWGGASI